MILHSAFALTIASDIPLPELPPGSGRADVHVHVGQLDATPPDDDAWSVTATPGEAHGWAPGAGAFRVRNGNEIVIDVSSGADDRAVRLAVVGPLLGVILAQRGQFVLHASTVVVDGHAVSFAGPSGRGKSTLAAAMTRAGYALIADDMTVINADAAPPLVQPGFPRVKLWPDSASALTHDADALPLIHPDRTKRSLQVRERFQADPVPLARCYLLEDGDSESVAELPGTDAILSLVRYTYQASWMHDTGVSGPNLLQCGALARSGVVRRLTRRRAFDALTATIAFIEADVRSRPV
jgi:hypothetical protein